MGKDVFISYASEDMTLAVSMEQELERRKISVWRRIRRITTRFKVGSRLEKRSKATELAVLDLKRGEVKKTARASDAEFVVG